MPNPANKLTIAVDIDEVLMPHFQDLIDWYNQKYGTKLTLKHNHPSDPGPWGTPDYNEAISRVQEFFSTPEFINSQPFREAKDAVNQLSNDFRLIVLTGRDKIIEDVTRHWLDEHFGELFQEVHFTARYSLEGLSKNKAEVLKNASADYFIDDDLEHCTLAIAVGVKPLLFGDYPWNQAKELPNGVTRVKSWQEVLEYFENEPAG